MEKVYKDFGVYFDDFSEGQIISHATRKTIFESDNNFFSLITMNHHPVHLDVDYCSKNIHGKILVVGTYVFSLAVGITVPDVSGKAIANLEYLEIKHIHPVFINDTIRVETEVLSKKESSSKLDRGVITVRSIVYNQSDVSVLSFVRKVLVKRRV